MKVHHHNQMGNTKLEKPDNSALTLHYIGVAYGYNNDDVYIPTSAEVYNSIDQDHLFSPTNDNNITLSEEEPAFLGMVLTANDDDDEPESEPEDMDDNEPEPLPVGFDVNDPINVLATAIHCASLDQTSSEATAESWFESVRAKLKICGIGTSTEYQQLFGSSVGQEINNCIRNNHFQPMF